MARHDRLGTNAKGKTQQRGALRFAGEYTVAVRNPAQMEGRLDGYVDKARPRVTTVQIVPARRPVSPPRLIDVSDYLPAGFPLGGLDWATVREPKTLFNAVFAPFLWANRSYAKTGSGQPYEELSSKGGYLSQAEPANATQAVLSALEAARAYSAAADGPSSSNGGTTAPAMQVVRFPRGKWFINGPLDIPANTKVVGADTHLTSLYFYEDQLSTAPGCKWSAWGPGKNCTDR